MMGMEFLISNGYLVSAIFTILAGVLGYLYAPYWGVRRVPGPRTIPFLGHLHLLAKHGPDLFPILAKQYGPVFRFHMGRQPLVIVADVELCREVGVRKFKAFSNRSIPSPIAASPLLRKGVMFSRGARWSRMRNTIVSVYQPSYIASLIPTMQSYIESATRTLDDLNEDINLSVFSHTLVTDVVGEAAFGVNFGLSRPQSDSINKVENGDDQNDDEVSDFINQHIDSLNHLKIDLSGSLSIILGLLVPIVQEPFRQILKRIPGTMDWKIERTSQKLSSRVDQIVMKRMNDSERGTKNFLSLILDARESEGAVKSVFTPDYVSAVTYEHLLAGPASTSFALSSTVYLISNHPEVETKLLAEIDAFGPHDLIPTADDLEHKFPYLDQVIKEAMRIYLASPLTARETTREVEIGGYLLPKGTWVWLALGVLAHDPKNFPEPEKFKPERFDPSGEEEKQRHKYAFLPFGIGPLGCLGQKFALQSIKLTLIHLYRKYIFRHSPDMETPPELEYNLVLSFKNGVKLAVKKRT